MYPDPCQDLESRATSLVPISSLGAFLGTFLALLRGVGKPSAQQEVANTQGRFIRETLKSWGERNLNAYDFHWNTCFLSKIAFNHCLTQFHGRILHLAQLILQSSYGSFRK